ncbi:MAG: nuclear transport factor 2 family protein [Actinobacteria bacterium]|nr:MAG: nuclear transport factor 2 family protein [Actinomycetota bacterium]
MAPSASGADATRTFIQAFNDGDLDALVAVLDPEVEIQASGGIVLGHDEVRRWATRKPTGDLHQRLVLDTIRDEGKHVIAFTRREWFWREGGDVADAQDLAIVATIGEDGLITRWQPFDNRDEALQAVGVGTEEA